MGTKATARRLYPEKRAMLGSKRALFMFGTTLSLLTCSHFTPQ